MKSLFGFLVFLILSTSVLQAVETVAIDLDNFFKVAKTRSLHLNNESNYDVTDDDIAYFKSTFSERVQKFELGSCHVVYQLLGVLIAQVDQKFHNIATRVMLSHADSLQKNLLFELTGYTWDENKKAEGKNAEVATTILWIEGLRKRDAKDLISADFLKELALR